MSFPLESLGMGARSLYVQKNSRETMLPLDSEDGSEGGAPVDALVRTMLDDSTRAQRRMDG